MSMNRTTRPARIALVNAPPFGLYEPQYDTPRFTRYALAVLAGHLRAHGVSELLLIDAKFERIGYREIRRRLAAFKPDVVGLTAFTPEIVQCGHVATLVKDLARHEGREIVTIVGGVHATAIPEQTLEEFPQFDLVGVGEGEDTLLDLARWVERGGPRTDWATIRGLCYRDTSGNPARSPARPNLNDQREIPLPAWDLLPPSPTALVMTSRGCPYACNFCMNPNGKKVRRRDVQPFLDEVQWLIDERGMEDLHICDEIFTLDKDRTHEILDGLIEMGFGERYTFHAQTHVRCIDQPLLEKIARAGCTFLGFGMETGDPEVLKQMGKGTNLEVMLKAVELSHHTGVELGTFFILGQPDETLKSAWNTVKLAIKSNPRTPIFGVMVPFPGTKVWEWANRGEHGYRLRSPDWNDFNKQIGDALEFEGIDRRAMEVLQLAGYSLVFLANGRWMEFGRFVQRYQTEGFTVLRKILTGAVEERHARAHRSRRDLSPAAIMALDASLPFTRPFDPQAPLPLPLRAPVPVR